MIEMLLGGVNIKADNPVQAEFECTVTYRLLRPQQIMQHALTQPLSADYSLACLDIIIYRMENDQPGNDNVCAALGQPVQLLALLKRRGRQDFHEPVDRFTGQGVAV
ncbi:hypothetical protein D3C80_1793890 [compost metagenome]